MTADATTVRSLITSVTALVRFLGDLTPNAVYRWIKVNRIPGKYLIRIAQFYDIDVPIHLAASDRKNPAQLNYKPRDTLPLCLAVQAGDLSVDAAAAQLGLHPQAVQLILRNWGEQLPLLYQTLCQLDAKTLSLDAAAARLQVTKHNIHALRKKYGFRPPPRPKAPPRPIVQRRQTARQVALACIAGQYTLAEAEQHCDLSWRTIHRAIAKLSPAYSLIELTHWPKAFREALAKEIADNRPRLSEKLWKFAEISQIPLKKWPKYPEIPADWRGATVKRMLVHLLLGDETLTSLAEKRGADPHMLEALLTGDLRPLGLTWPDVVKAPLYSQIALAELILALDAASKSPRQKMIERRSEAQPAAQKEPHE